MKFIGTAALASAGITALVASHDTGIKGCFTDSRDNRLKLEMPNGEIKPSGNWRRTESSEQCYVVSSLTSGPVTIPYLGIR